jgi:hypothetical protein
MRDRIVMPSNAAQSAYTGMIGLSILGTLPHESPKEHLRFDSASVLR